MTAGITPPQGLIAVLDKRTIYGFPMGIGVGGGGTRVTATLPPSYSQASGQRIRLIGEYAPAVLPPVEETPRYGYQYPAGMKIRIVTNTPKTATPAGIRAMVIPDAAIPKARNGSGFCLASVSVVTI